MSSITLTETRYWDDGDDIEEDEQDLQMRLEMEELEDEYYKDDDDDQDD